MCEAHAEFVARFEKGWSAPSVDGLGALLCPDAHLVAPLTEETATAGAGREELERILTLLPDVRGTVHRWACRGDDVFIEFDLAATVGHRRVAWPVVDRITVREGLVAERISYQDSAPLLALVARTPSVWLRAWRAGLGPPALRRLARRLARR